MRYLPATLNVRALVVPLAAVLLVARGGAAVAQPRSDIQTPVEVRSVELRFVEDGADVVIGVASEVEWTADQGPSGTLTIRLPRSVPGPRALDVTPSSGFVSRIGVGFAVPEGVPTSRITVYARQVFRHRVVRERNGCELSSVRRGRRDYRLAEATSAASQEVAPTPQPDLESSPQSTGGQADELEQDRDQIAGLERALARALDRSEQSAGLQAELQSRLDEVQRESESHRQRVSELHADRLQLIEDLRIARQAAAEASSAADAGRTSAVDRQDLEAVVSERDAARSEASELRQRLAANESELAGVVDNRENLAGELAASEDRRREESAELARISDELVSLRSSRQDASRLEQSLAGVTADRDRLARELRAASGNVEDARAAQLAETAALRRQVEELQSARDLAVQRLSEVERDLGRSEAEGTRLSIDLAAAQTRAAAGLEEESAESAALRSRVAALSQSVAEAETLAEKAAKDLEASREQAQRLEQDLADARREIEGGELEVFEGLKAELEESRRSEADLRGWLTRAPRILGVSSMAVAQSASPCLSFRPQPSRQSPVLDCLIPGTVVEVLNMRADWLRVRLADRREGWVGQRFMEASTPNDLSQLTAARQSANEEIEKLRSDRDALTSRLADFERKGVEAREAVAREQTAHTEEIERLRSQLAAATAEKSSLENQLAGAVSKSAGLAEMEAELATLAAENEASRLQQEELRQELAIVAERAMASETTAGEAERLRDRVGELEAAAAASKAASEAAQMNMRDALSTAEAEAREAVAREQTAHTEEIERLRSQLAAATAEKSSLENQLAGAVSKSAGLAEMEAELATLAAENEASRLQQEELRQELATVAERATASETTAGEAERLRDRVGELEAAAAASEAASEAAREAATEAAQMKLRDALSTAEAEAESRRQSAIVGEELKGRLARLETDTDKQLALLRSELESASTVRDQAQAEVARLERENELLAVAGAEHNELLSEHDSLRSDVESAGVQIRELEDRAAAAEAEATALRQAASSAEDLQRRLVEVESSSADQLALLRAELETASMAAIESQATIAALQLSNDRLAGERQLREAVAEDRDSLAAEADSAGRRIEELEAALATAQLNGKRLETSVSAAREKITTLRGAADEVDGLREQATGQAESIDELTAQIEGLRSELAGAQSALAQTRSDLVTSDGLVRDKMLRLTEIAGAGAIVVSSAADPCLKLRAGPAAAAEAYDCVEPGTRFTLLDLDGEWVEVAGSGDRRGWVSADYMESESGRRIRHAEADLETAQRRIGELEEAGASSEQGAAEQIASLRADLEAAREAAAAAVEVARSEAEALAAEASAAEASAGEMHAAELEKLRQELEAERRNSSQAIASRDGLTEEIRAARQRIQEFELSEGVAATETLAQVDGLRARLSEAESRLATTDSSRQQLQDDLDRAREREVELGHRLAVAEEEAAALRQTRQEFETEVASRATMEAELATAREQMLALETAEADLAVSRTELEQARRELEAADLSAETLRAEVGRLRALHEEALEEVGDDSSEEKLRVAQERIAELEFLLEEGRVEIETQVAAHSRRTAELEGELAALQRESELLREGNETLAARLAAQEPLVPVQEPVTALGPLGGVEDEPIEISLAEDETPESPRPNVRSSELASFALGWAQAWSAQDVELYLSYYSPGFQPAYGIGRSRWEAQRRERLAAPTFVEVELSSIGVRIDSPTRAAVSFSQLYRSDTFEDVVTKTLEVALEAGEWKILREVAE